MSTKMTARGIVGSLRLLVATAAVVAGMAGLSTVGATSAVAADGNVPQRACDNMADANVSFGVMLKHGCIDISDDGEILGGSIFS